MSKTICCILSPAPAASDGSGEGFANHADEFIDGGLAQPAADCDQIVLRTDPEHVTAGAAADDAARRTGVEALAGAVQPPHEAIFGTDVAGRGRLFDPLFREDLAAVPATPVQYQLAKAGMVAAGDEQAAAPMAAAGDGLNFAA